MADILAVGIATLDIINSVDGYPAEDSEVRAMSQRLCRGGNATNTLTILSQLGHRSHWAGVLADEPDAHHIITALARQQIDTSAVLTQHGGKVPTSYILHNVHNGSRTIVHHRDLPEYPFSAFEKIDLTPLAWVHFEGRNTAETQRMLARCKQQHPTLTCSLEIEKERPQIDTLFPLADLLLFSRAFARQRGFDSATAFLSAMQKRAPGKNLICAWGEEGAYGLDNHDDFHYSPAFAPDELVDTLGAGDTFNAGVIDAQLKGLSMKESLRRGCQLAGQKCGHHGLEFIAPNQPILDNGEENDRDIRP